MTAPTRQSQPTTPYFGPTFVQMQGDVLRPLGYTTTSAPTNLLAEAKRLLNTACAQMMTLHPQDFWTEKYTTITTVANQATYTLPLGLLKITSCVLDSVYLDALPDDYKNKRYQIRNTNPYDDGTATQFYCVYGVDNTAVTSEPAPILELYPPPDTAGTLVLRYRGLDNALSADTDLFRCSPAFSAIPTYYATGVILLTSGEGDRAQQFLGLYESENDKLRMTDQRSRSEKDTLILPSFGKSKYPTRTNNGQIP